MAEDIGSPKLDDPTGRNERIVNDSLTKLESIVDKMIPEIVNRPLGSQRMSDDDLLLEWRPILGDSEQLAERLQGMMAQEGEARGREMFVETVLKVQELA